MDTIRPGGKTAFLFAGQGAQYSGMGRDLYEHDENARWVFAEAEKLCPGISSLCFNGTEEELRQTAIAQPAIFTVDLAAAAALEARRGKPRMLAGFSLGEIAALVFAGSLSFGAGFQLVRERGSLMQRAGEENPGVMTAVLKLDNETVEQLCRGFEHIYPVNYNGPGQLAVAGAAEEMEGFKEAVKQAGGRVMPLAVSGAFHCPLMAQAAAEFGQTLAGIETKRPGLPVYANATARPYAGDAAELLAQQLLSPVRWQSSIENMLAAGADAFVELGPGHTLSNLINRIAPEARVYHVEDMESLQKTVEGLCLC